MLHIITIPPSNLFTETPINKESRAYRSTLQPCERKKEREESNAQKIREKGTRSEKKKRRKEKLVAYNFKAPSFNPEPRL